MSKKIHDDADTATLRATMGPRLRAARKALGLTQEDAAELIGISSEFYARMERGNALPSVETLAKLADKLQVTVDYLLGADDPTTALAARPLVRGKDPRQMTYVIDRSRDDPELTRLLISLLKIAEKREEGADEGQGQGQGQGQGKSKSKSKSKGKR